MAEARTVRNHGRLGADDYTGAEKIERNASVASVGRSLSAVRDGHVYDTGRPGVVLRLVGQPPVGAKVYYLQKLRCNLCGALFTASLPEGVGGEKHDATVGSMIALLRYGTGMPLNRAGTLQANLGIPLPASTQWDIVADQAERAEPVFDELARQAAQGEVLYNDDTTVKILEVMGERSTSGSPGGREPAEAAAEDSRGESAKKSKRERRARSPRASCRPAKGAGSPCSSAGASMPGRTWPTCCGGVRRNCPRRSRCATR